MKSITYIIFVFLVVGCLPAELDNIQAFEYSFPELEDVENLPDVISEIPVEELPTDGDILITEEADLLAVNVIEAVIDDNISEENITIIEKFAEVAPEVSDDYINTEVTNEWIDGIFSGDIEPSAEFFLIKEEFEDNEDFLAYLTNLDFPTVDGIIPGGRIKFTEEVGKSFSPFQNRLTSLVTPCKEAVEELYIKNLKTWY